MYNYLITYTLFLHIPNNHTNTNESIPIRYTLNIHYIYNYYTLSTVKLTETLINC